ncbi:Glycosaminoglycan xylosylkinase [Microtus ochrogaster]|uniref:Glycosaminoglycan xylosylkinase n=2 Tax=Cricetidae TaxID=337677 RepID=A0A8J6GPR3_MICOH|nr:Glycosaminoglycan xylosylkinase [Microtus ochrogaster]
MKLKQRVVLLAILLVIFIFTKVFLIDNLDTSAANREDQRAFHRMMTGLRVELVPKLDNTLQSPWEIAAQWMVPREVYPKETPELGAIMHAMATKKIIKADVGYKGTQLKALLILEGGQKVVFKPKRYSRDYVVEGEPYAGYDRHNAEVAAFHLDSAARSLWYGTVRHCDGKVVQGGEVEKRVVEWFMGWERGKSEEVTVVRNRLMGMTCLLPESKVMPNLAIAKGQSCPEALKQLRSHDLMSVAPVITEGHAEAYGLGARILGFRRAPLVVGRYVNLRTEIKPVATEQLLSTFLTVGNNTCFYGKCYYCRETEPACADGDMMEGSITLWLPDVWPLQKHRHPWGRTYREGKLARWEYDESYCDAVKKTSPYDSGPRLLDIIDTAVFDYLIGNADRHHYESFQDDEGASMLILLDNAKSIRVSTWNRLNYLKNGVLKSALKSAMAHDPISPVLSDPHLDTVDQRLLNVLATVKQCTDQFGMDTVLVEDRMPLSHL